MVKLKGQLLSLDATGTIAKTLVFSSWKGRPYAKQFKVPTDPNTPGQLGLRQSMAFLSSQWSFLSEAERTTWIQTASDREITALDQYNSVNLLRFTQNKGMSKRYPPPEATNTVTMISQLPLAYERYVELGASTSPGQQSWGYVFYQDASTGFTPSPSNVVSVIFGMSYFTVRTARVVPPGPGTWYSRYASFNQSGTLKLIAIERSIVWPP